MRLLPLTLPIRNTYLSYLCYAMLCSWRYDHRIYDVAGLVGFICAFRIGTYFALKYVNNKKN